MSLRIVKVSLEQCQKHITWLYSKSKRKLSSIPIKHKKTKREQRKELCQDKWPFDAVYSTESLTVQTLWDSNREFKCCLCLRLKLTIWHLEEWSERPLTIDHRLVGNKNSFNWRCEEAEINVHIVRSFAYSTKGFFVEDSRSCRKNMKRREDTTVPCHAL